MPSTAWENTPPHVHHDLHPPSRLLWLAEGRSVWELGFALTFAPLLMTAPRGDGHPVLFLPGFIGSDASTTPLRAYFKLLGYDVHGWGLGRNFGGVARMRGPLLQRLAEVYERTGRRVSVVGWSLGGVYARLLAVEAPALVRSVITLGSPFSRHPRATNVSELYHTITGEGPTEEEIELEMLRPHEFDKVGHDIEVPTTSIYSKLDGVVDWRSSLLRPNGWTENVEVFGASHVGLGVNAAVLWIAADRLAQRDGTFVPFAGGGPFALAYRRSA
jgi:hypothetical protein